MAGKGFAAMHPDILREIASKGGKASHEKGTAHEWTSETGRKAARKTRRSLAKQERDNAGRS